MAKVAKEEAAPPENWRASTAYSSQLKTANDSMKIAMRKENLGKNRSTEFVAFDSNRVQLSNGAYINASWIKDNKWKFIITQVPYPHSHDEFWQMVWETNSRTIVLLGDFCDAGSEQKIAETVYFNREPSAKVFSIDGTSKLTVSTAETQQMLSFTQTSLILKLNNEKSRVVKHFQFKDWPKDGVPDVKNAVEKFLLFLFYLRKEKFLSREKNSSIIQSLWGSSRSCCFSLILLCLTNLIETKKLKRVHPEKVLPELQCHRYMKIETEDQIRFCYDVLMAAEKSLTAAKWSIEGAYANLMAELYPGAVKDLQQQKKKK